LVRNLEANSLSRLLYLKQFDNRFCRVGQNHLYTAYIQYFRLKNHQTYGVYIRIYTVLANPTLLLVFDYA